MSSGGGAPDTPDYVGAAKETSAGNLDVARYTTEANRVDQINPWGAITWKKETAPTYDMAAYSAAMEKYNADFKSYNDRAAGGGDGNPYFTGTLTADGLPVFGYSPYNDIGSAPIKPDLEQFKTDTTDHWTQTQTLNPDSQAALDSQLALIKNKSQLANDIYSRVADTYSTAFDPATATSIKQPTDMPGFDASKYITASAAKDAPAFDSSYLPSISAPNSVPTFDHEAMLQAQKAAYDSGSSLLRPQFEQAQSRLDNKLALQGLAPTSESYQTSMGNTLRSQNEAYTNLANQAVLTGNQTGINLYNAALAGTQQQQNLYNQQLQNGLAAYNAKLSGNQQQQNLVNQQLQNGLAQYSAQLTGTQAQQGLYNQQLANALAQYNLPLNTVNSLLSNTQITAPSFGSYAQQANVSGADLLGAAQAQYGAALGSSNAANAASAQNFSGLMGMGNLGMAAYKAGLFGTGATAATGAAMAGEAAGTYAALDAAAAAAGTYGATEGSAALAALALA